MRLYHPQLGRETEVPSERVAAVLAESGWRPAPEPERTSPAVVSEPTVYEPVTPKAKSAPKSSDKPAKSSEKKEAD